MIFLEKLANIFKGIDSYFYEIQILNHRTHVRIKQKEEISTIMVPSPIL